MALSFEVGLAEIVSALEKITKQMLIIKTEWFWKLLILKTLKLLKANRGNVNSILWGRRLLFHHK